ncbi:hypothetical protein DFH09DRAFT_1508186 [Mycena vulgaris]|nr:hypothetical protein DFH09DRAFT_1508186 [Mycena vulgaris]
MEGLGMEVRSRLRCARVFKPTFAGLYPLPRLPGAARHAQRGHDVRAAARRRPGAIAAIRGVAGWGDRFGARVARQRHRECAGAAGEGIRQDGGDLAMCCCGHARPPQTIPRFAHTTRDRFKHTTNSTRDSSQSETRGRDPFRFAYTACAPAIFTNSSTRTTQTGNPAVSLAPSPFVSFAHSRRPQERHGPPRGARRRQEPPCPLLVLHPARPRSRTLVCADRVQRRCLNHEAPGVDVARGRDPPQIAHPPRDACASSRCKWRSRTRVQQRREARDGVDELHARRRIALPPRSARPRSRSSSPVLPLEADGVVAMALGEPLMVAIDSRAPPSAPRLLAPFDTTVDSADAALSPPMPAVPRDAAVVHLALCEPLDTTVAPGAHRPPLPILAFAVRAVRDRRHTAHAGSPDAIVTRAAPTPHPRRSRRARPTLSSPPVVSREADAVVATAHVGPLDAAVALAALSPPPSARPSSQFLAAGTMRARQRCGRGTQSRYRRARARTGACFGAAPLLRHVGLPALDDLSAYTVYLALLPEVALAGFQSLEAAVGGYVRPRARTMLASMVLDAAARDCAAGAA